MHATSWTLINAFGNAHLKSSWPSCHLKGSFQCRPSDRRRQPATPALNPQSVMIACDGSRSNREYPTDHLTISKDCFRAASIRLKLWNCTSQIPLEINTDFFFSIAATNWQQLEKVASGRRKIFIALFIATGNGCLLGFFFFLNEIFGRPRRQRLHLSWTSFRFDDREEDLLLLLAFGFGSCRRRRLYSVNMHGCSTVLTNVFYVFREYIRVDTV